MTASEPCQVCTSSVAVGGAPASSTGHPANRYRIAIPCTHSWTVISAGSSRLVS